MKQYFWVWLIVILLILPVFAIDYNPTPTQVVTTSGVRIRSSVDYKKVNVIGIIEKGIIAQVLDVYGDYYKITAIKKGKTITGWVYQDLLSVNKDKINAVVKGKGCTVRSGPTTKSKPITSLAGGTQVTINDLKITWLKIKALDIKKKEIVGWGFADYMKKK